jgi:hypothetical protein
MNGTIVSVGYETVSVKLDKKKNENYTSIMEYLGKYKETDDAEFITVRTTIQDYNSKNGDLEVGYTIGFNPLGSERNGCALIEHQASYKA